MRLLGRRFPTNFWRRSSWPNPLGKAKKKLYARNHYRHDMSRNSIHYLASASPNWLNRCQESNQNEGGPFHQKINKSINPVKPAEPSRLHRLVVTFTLELKGWERISTWRSPTPSPKWASQADYDWAGTPWPYPAAVEFRRSTNINGPLLSLH